MKCKTIVTLYIFTVLSFYLLISFSILFSAELMVGKSKHCLKEEVVSTIFNTVHEIARKCQDSLIRRIKKAPKSCVLKELKVNCLLEVALALRQLNPIHKKGP